MDTSFSDWLTQQMRERDWSQAELARESGLTRQAIGRYLAEKTKTPDEFALQKIAHAFDLPTEIVYRAAGILPYETQHDEELEKILYEVKKMNKQDQAEVLAYIRMKNNLRKKK